MKIRKQNSTENKLDEIIWAEVYHDSIRGKKYVEELSLNIGRWAGNYSFFYLLNVTIHEMRPKNILEFGLGESTKFVAACSNHIVEVENHIVIEHDEDWIKLKSRIWDEHNKTKIIKSTLENKFYKGFDTLSYAEIDHLYSNTFDLFIVDGPFGSKRFSRHQIIYFVKNFKETSDFVILMDDIQRQGEKDTMSEILTILKELEIEFYHEEFSGIKTVGIITSRSFKYLTTT